MVDEAATSLSPEGAASEASQRWRRRAWQAFQVLIAVAFVFLAARQVTPAQLARDLGNVHLEWLAFAFSVYLFSRAVNAWEWQVLLTKVGHAPLPGLLGILLIGTFVNAVLPGNLGDVAKIQLAANRYSLPRAGLVGSRGAEALINNVVFAAFVVLGLFLVRGAGFSQASMIVVGGLSLAMTCGAVVVSRILPASLSPGFGRWLPERARHLATEHWPRFHDGLEVIRRPRLLVSLLFMNFFGWAIDIAIYYAYGQAFSLDVPITAFVTITVTLALVTSMPITFGNIGTWELGLVGILGLYDVPADRALAFAAGAHLIITLFNIALGIVATAVMSISLADVLRVRGSQQPAVAPASAA